MHTRIQSYIQQFNQIFNGEPWLGESFGKKLNEISEKQAFTKSPDNNHSVADIVSHVTVWRKEIIRRLIYNSSERLLTEESIANWKNPEELQQAGWQQLYIDLKQSQEQIIQLLENKDDSFLESQLAETEFNKEYFLAGILHHDIYHLGQIGLILKWAK